MNRRDFLASGLAAGAAAAIPAIAAAQEAKVKSAGKGPFKLNYAPHFDQFKAHAGENPLDQLKFIADEGFRALEDNGMMGRPPEEQEKIGKEMQRLGLTMGGFCASIEFGKPTLVLNDAEIRKQLVKDVQAALETAKRVNGKWSIIVPGCFEPRFPIDYQTANVVDNLRAAAEIAEPTGLILIIEPLNWRDHPNLFVRTIGHAYQICRAVNSPAVKILDDLYHQQITEGDLIRNIDRAYSEIAYFHLGDNPGRKEPGTGEVNFRGVFKFLHGKGYKGVLGMEHGTSKPGKEGERALIEAYRACDDF
jgi:hydroxypyruvate isomerase